MSDVPSMHHQTIEVAQHQHGGYVVCCGRLREVPRHDPLEGLGHLGPDRARARARRPLIGRHRAGGRVEDSAVL